MAFKPWSLPAKAETRTPRLGSKRELLVTLLGRKAGATIDELCAALSWGRSTVTGAFRVDVHDGLGFGVKR